MASLTLRKASTRFNHLLWQQSPKCTNLSLVNGVKHMSSLETLGFIGLGNMGNHMARNLVKKGHKLVVFDVSKNAMKTIENMEGCENCVQTVNSPADVAAQCKHIITMLPATQHVQEVYTSRGTGIFSAIQENSLLVDSSTIDPAASQEMAAIASEKDSSYVDAPVSGGVNAARDAALTFMVGGAPRSFEMAQKYLSVMGRNVVHCGPVGTGQAAKICNNMLLGISMIGTSEAMNLGKKLGLEPKLLAKILNTSSGRCWSSEVYNPCPGVLDGVPSSNNYEGGFGTALMTKDLGLANNAATVNKSPIPMGSLAHQIYRIMTSSGYAGKDFSSAYQFLQDQEEKS